MDKWTERYLRMAEEVAQWSKDPSTKCGAVIVDHTNHIVSVGFNGFAAGVKDDPERYNDRSIKYQLVLHAEDNAILSASYIPPGCTLFTWPMQPCSLCAAKIIQKRFAAVIFPSCDNQRWAESFKWANIQFTEAGVRCQEIKLCR